jgi:hypothetical protein
VRLLDVFQKEDYQPLERGCAFPQYYENGDLYKWHHPFCWSYQFWKHLQWDALSRREDDLEMLLMGGEL